MNRFEGRMITVVGALAVLAQGIAFGDEGPAVHLAIGDSAQSVEHALHVNEEPNHATIQRRTTGEIRLQARGIWIFLDASNRAYEFRFDPPFMADVNGARIGDDIAQIGSALGPPVKALFAMSPYWKSYLYRPGSGETIRVDFDETGRAHTIRVLAGAVTFGESSSQLLTVPGSTAGGRAPTHGARTSKGDTSPPATEPSYLPAPGIITGIRNMDHSATFPEPPVPEILDLGRLSGGVNSSYASAVSGDGNVVVGSANHGNYSDVAFTWTLATGMVSLDQSFFIRPFAYASAVNCNGTVVVGARVSEGSSLMRAFRWTRETGIVTLGILPGTDRSEALSVNRDGSVVVGLSGDTAFRWTEATGMVPLPGRSIFSPVVVTGDGRTVYATQLDTSGFHVIRWNTDGSITRYPNPPGVGASFVEAVASNGSVIVGLQERGSRNIAVGWYSPSQMIYLGSLDGGASSKATAVNADGTVIVGVVVYRGSNNKRGTVFRWTKANGMQSLADWIVSSGGSSPQSNPIEAEGVSGDGSVVVGALRNGDPFVAIDPSH